MCWGNNSKLQAGQPSSEDWPRRGPSSRILQPKEVAGIDDAVAISAGDEHSCALRKSGSVACWGSGIYGRLGDGRSSRDSAQPVEVVGVSNAIAIDAMGKQSCALQQDGRVLCWGGDAASSGPPRVIDSIKGAAAISVGGEHACALDHLGRVLCWGHDESGQLGEGLSWAVDTPTEVVGLHE
jgi:alpha-tubulin suppressor-like RCC1 family protein